MLNEKLKDWTDWDITMQIILQSWGIIGKDEKLLRKELYYHNDIFSDSIHEIVDQMVKCGILENNGEAQFRFQTQYDITTKDGLDKIIELQTIKEIID